jgi:FkbM family methyltransferase
MTPLQPSRICVRRGLLRVPGVVEVLGPIARVLSKLPAVPDRLARRLASWLVMEWPIPSYLSEVRTNTAAGVPITLAAHPWLGLIGYAYYLGLEGFEPATVRLFAKLATRSRVIVDVGANVGLYTLLAAAVAPEASILAVEPMPLAVLSLGKSVSLSHHRGIKVVAVALSDQERLSDLSVSLVHTSESSLDPAWVLRDFTLCVRCTTLDTLVAESNVAVDLLKIDVEGCELQVLQGAETAVSRGRPVVILEVLPSARWDEIAAFFARHRYFMYAAEGEGKEPLERSGLAGLREANAVAIPGEKLDSVLPLLKG